jgi:hypothetical protein
MKKMKIMVGLLALATLILSAGCEVRAGYRGGYYGGYEGEYPHRYYGHEGYVYRHHPYDRDHYWDRGYYY